MAHFIENGSATNLVRRSSGESDTVDLYGGGPGGAQLDVVSTDPSVCTISEVPVSIGPDLRQFDVRGVGAGSARIEGRLSTGRVFAWARVIVGRGTLYRYYHGTSSAIADILMTVDLEPMLITRLLGATRMAFDWTDYTDFGKGFYVHLAANKKLAFDWARRRFGNDWAVVEFVATPEEMRDLWSTALHFANKRARPHNSPTPIVITTTRRSLEICPVPQLFPIVPCVEIERRETTARVASGTMSWLKFVEYNRHIDPTRALIARPNDRDWTSTYSRIRGPIWVPRDSGYNTGLPKFPDSVHQLNWGQGGMDMLNKRELKERRFKFSAANEGLFPPPR